MSSPINLELILRLVNQYLVTRIAPVQISALSKLSDTTFTEIIADLDAAIGLYNTYPSCLSKDLIQDIFINTNHLKTLVLTIPAYSKTLNLFANTPHYLDEALAEMRDSTYFHHIYEIKNPEHLFANLMTLTYRCHLLSSISGLREGDAQVSSTLEEMSALRYLLGEGSLHHRATRHWILDWEGEGFSQELAKSITKA